MAARLSVALAIFVIVTPAIAASDADLASCQQTGDLDRSIIACGHLVGDKSESDQDRAVMSLYRGAAFMARNDLEWAILDFDRALALDPQNVFGYVNRAIALSRLESPDLAARDFRKASEIDPSKVEGMLAGNDELAKIRSFSQQTPPPNTPGPMQTDAIDCDRLLHTRQPFSMVQVSKNSDFANRQIIKTRDVYRRDDGTTLEIWKWNDADTGIREVYSKGLPVERISKQDGNLTRASFNFTPAASLLDKQDFQVTQSFATSSTDKNDKSFVSVKYWGQTEVTVGSCRIPALLYEEKHTYVEDRLTRLTKRTYAPDLDTDLFSKNAAGRNLSHTFATTTEAISTDFIPLVDPTR